MQKHDQIYCTETLVYDTGRCCVKNWNVVKSNTFFPL